MSDRKTMDFPDAIRQVIAGRKITKLEWRDPKTYVMLAGGFLMLFKPEGAFRLVVSDGDLLGMDWVTCDRDD